MKREDLKLNESIAQIEIDRYRPIYYAAASGDFSPLHIDAELARSFGLKSNILHGLCTVAMVIDAVSERIGESAGVRKFRCRFVSPLFPGDRMNISVEGTDRNSLTLNVMNQENRRILEKVTVCLDDSEFE